ncbi:MAG: DUF2059 domain-containing protein [Candidatus Omnitrophica bacterium]|nr:DUF2059 domain-containing protein [Candidatus Omnitrophota bacterium]
MKNKILRFSIAAVLIFGMTSFAAADDASKRQKAEDLLKIMNMDTEIGEMVNRLQQLAQQRLDAQNFPEGLYSKLDTLSDKEFDMLRKELTWSYMKDDYIDLYMDKFTEEELVELGEFYKTDLGKKLMEQTPELVLRGMSIGQKKLVEKQTKVQQSLHEDMMNFEASLTDEERKLLQGSLK